MPVRRSPRLVAALLAPALLAACGGGSSGPSAAGVPTLTTIGQCNVTGIGQPTYVGFAAGFFTSYCTRCHAAALTGAARNGAPVGHDFDTYAGAKQWTAHIDEQSAANPIGTVTNTTMPPDAPQPTLAERRTLACWIAGGALP